MNTIFFSATRWRHQLLAMVYAAVSALAVSAATAGPGAHGPNGEHLAEQAPNAAGIASTPRFKAKTEVFELVGVLAGGELSLLIDRFETNEPVLRAAVEVEAAGVRASASFHADHGDYSVTDPKLVQALAQPGQHPIVITVMAAAGESDLLEATLETPASAAAHPHDHTTGRARWAAAGLAAALLAATAWWFVRRRATCRTERAGA